MTLAEKLIRDIETLRESIKLDGIDFASLSLTPEERAGIIKHMEWCMIELEQLNAKLSAQRQE